MQNWREFKYWSKNGVYLGLIILFVSMGMGCASTHKTTKTETTVTTYSPADRENNKGYIAQQQDTPISEKSETTTTTTEAKAEHPGILSSTLHAIGYVVSLPFIIVGGLLRMIF
ncbi:MAG: hypothetical protein A2Z88_02455 [Omnitrophica WOR_2 bacterium GWA2_47_8]|nr:MAG: hypothetical protein A2Z88_02455 [Omnitrophica WOR_2 bacterium GWA2_47_8]